MYFNWSLGRGDTQGRPGEVPAHGGPIPLRPAGTGA
jgi:hypothetical protein